MTDDQAMDEELTAIWSSDPAPKIRERLAELTDGPLPNPALQAELASCVQYRGDWLAIVIGPAHIHMLLLPGGGDLWGTIPVGQLRYLNLGGIASCFEAARDPVLGDYQFNVLVGSGQELPDMAAARLVASDTLRTLAVEVPVAALAPEVAPVEEEPKLASRRAFLSVFGRRS